MMVTSPSGEMLNSVPALRGETRTFCPSVSTKSAHPTEGLLLGIPPEALIVMSSSEDPIRCLGAMLTPGGTITPRQARRKGFITFPHFKPEIVAYETRCPGKGACPKINLKSHACSPASARMARPPDFRERAVKVPGEGPRIGTFS